MASFQLSFDGGNLVLGCDTLEDARRHAINVGLQGILCDEDEPLCYVAQDGTIYDRDWCEVRLRTALPPYLRVMK